MRAARTVTRAATGRAATVPFTIAAVARPCPESRCQAIPSRPPTRMIRWSGLPSASASLQQKAKLRPGVRQRAEGPRSPLRPPRGHVVPSTPSFPCPSSSAGRGSPLRRGSLPRWPSRSPPTAWRIGSMNGSPQRTPLEGTPHRPCSQAPPRRETARVPASPGLPPPPTQSSRLRPRVRYASRTTAITLPGAVRWPFPAR